MEGHLLEELKRKLETSKKELEETLSAFATKDKTTPGDWDTRLPDFGPSNLGDLEQESDEVTEYANKLPVEHNLELKLLDVDLALKKIKEGGYGLCETCRKPIEEERLRIVPEARAHIVCQQ